jgi:hypothetical protein
LDPAAADADAGDAALKRLALAAAALLAVVAPALADGGRIRLRQTSGPFALTVFTAPEPLAVGPVDVSVLVQDGATGEVVMDADVTVRLRAPGADAFVERPTFRGTNRLLRSASVAFDAPGRWGYQVVVRRAGARAEVAGTLDVAPALARWRAAWPFLVAPPVAVALFLAGASRRRRTSPPSPLPAAR